MPTYDDLRVLKAVVEAGGFRPASQRLGLSASTISDTIRRLEDELGMRLVDRNTRSVMPTDAGRSVLEGVGPAFDRIDRTLARVRGASDEPTGRLRLTVPEVVARYVLPDIVARFLLAFPKVDVEVTSNPAVRDIVDAGYDAAIRYEERVERGMTTAPVGPRVQRYVAAAAPAYLAAHGVPEDPDDLSAHRLIGHRQASGAIRAWEFAKGRRKKAITPSGTIVASSVDVRVAAAVAGAGIIYTFAEVLGPAIAAGSLRVVLEDWSISFSGPILCYHGDRHVPAPLRAFLSFLEDRAEDAAVR